MTIAWKAAGATHRGRVRKGNEDSIRLDVERGIFVVADGMGGHAAGEVASGLAAGAALEILATGTGDARASLGQAFAVAHDRIVECCTARLETKGMGTTLTAAVLEPNGALHVGHIGDSRLYHLTGDAMRQVTHDHSWVQREIDSGRVSPDAAGSHPFSHILTRVLSAEESPDPDLLTLTVHPGELLLLCSDGLHNMLSAQEILDLLASEKAPETVVRRLVTAANRAGGVDNVSVIAVHIHEASR